MKETQELGDVREIPEFLESKPEMVAEFKKILEQASKKAKKTVDKLAKGVNDLNEELKRVADAKLTMSDELVQIMQQATNKEIKKRVYQELHQTQAKLLLVSRSILKIEKELKTIGDQEESFVHLRPHTVIAVQGTKDVRQQHLLELYTKKVYLESKMKELIEAKEAMDWVVKRDIIYPDTNDISDLLSQVNEIQRKSDIEHGVPQEELDEAEALIESNRKLLEEMK